MDGYICKICSKEYKTYKSLWNHNKKFHINITHNVIYNQQNMSSIHQELSDNTSSTNIYNCNYCNKEYNRKDNLTRHLKKCKMNNKKLIEENEYLKTENNKLKIQITQMINIQYKTHPKTLNRINKHLNSNNIINSNNTISSNNTFNIIQLGKEDLDIVLTNKEQINILNEKHNSLEYMIKYVHFNDKYPQFKNIMITNQQNNIAYKYDSTDNKFVAIDKNTLIDDLISSRMADLEEFLDNNIDRLDKKTVSKINEFINKITYNTKYDELKKKQIKILIYNNRDKLTKEIYQDLDIIV